MPTARTPFGLAELTPGLTDNTPNNNQVTIGGAFAYDNVFLMDGVDINDNVLGQPNDLFIEDAIEEVQVLTPASRPSTAASAAASSTSSPRAAATCSPARCARTSPTRRGASRRRSRRARARRGRASCRRPTKRPSAGRCCATACGSSAARASSGPRRREPLRRRAFPTPARTTTRRYEGKLTGTIASGHTLQGTVIDNRTDLVQPASAAASIPRR